MTAQDQHIIDKFKLQPKVDYDFVPLDGVPTMVLSAAATLRLAESAPGPGAEFIKAVVGGKEPQELPRPAPQLTGSLDRCPRTPTTRDAPTR